MIDLIFFTFFLGLFCVGFYCGKTYGTAKNMFSTLGKKVSALWD